MAEQAGDVQPSPLDMKMKGLLAVVFLCTGALGAYAYFAPHLTLKRMREAAIARDAAALSAHIDYPALRESLRGELRGKLAGLGAGDAPFPALRALGAAFAGTLVDPTVEVLVTPQSLALMMQGLPAALPGSPPPPGAPGPASVSPGDDPGAQAVETKMGYEGPSEFVVTVTARATPTLPFAFVLRREGLLSWKLHGVRLPAVPF